MAFNASFGFRTMDDIIEDECVTYRMYFAYFEKRWLVRGTNYPRKTLLNEFNHFEGNMNIFQPAIDIEDFALQREVNAIYERLAFLEREYAE